MTQQPPDREAIARVITDEFFRASDNAVIAHNTVHELKPYISRAADAILSSFPVGVGQTRIAEGGHITEQQPHAPSRAPEFNFHDHLGRQRLWSSITFGPGDCAKGVVDHIRKELCEIEADPTDLTEWIDVVILALDGAWRSGASPQQIIAALVAKQAKNEKRVWPDWRTADPNKAIEHERT